jgi:hypothetical protein
MRRSPHRLTLAAAAALLVLHGAGCSGYRVGVGTLYPADVQTVFVPVFESESFRPRLGEQLTEAVAKEIESKTTFKVVGDPAADTILTGRIIEDRKRALVENRFDDVRELETTLVVHVTWSRRDGHVLMEHHLPLDPTLEVVGSASVVPEVGQSVATAHQKAIRKIAQQIVGMMEAPW